MAITKSLDIGAVASATSVSVKQKNQNNAANLRPEKIVVIGQQSTSSATANNELYLASGNPDDAGVLFGFGSPLHRMAKKLFPKAGNGSKVETYFLPVAAPTTSTAEVKKIAATVATSVTKTFNGYLLLKDMIFEAAADVAGKVATIYHNNPAKAPRGTDLNSYETKSIPFTIIKGMTAEETIEALVSALEDYVEVPFNLDSSKASDGELTLTAKWKGSDGVFDISIVDSDGNAPTTAKYGVSFEITETTEGAGVGTIPDDALAQIDEELGVTRVISQYATTTVLDKLKDKFSAWHEGLVAQYVICYSAIKAPESSTVPGTWDVQTLITAGNARREDSVNVQIVGDFGKLRKLEYAERDKLLKAGYSNLVMKSDGSYRLMDLVTFYHPIGKTNPLYRFDRDVTVVANIAYDFMNVFRDSDEWKSIIIVSESDVTTNPAARSLKDVKAAVNTRIGLLGIAGLIANYANAQKNTEVEIDSSNPNRININPNFEITGVGRIYDITNFVGFYFGDKAA